jgi:hypothetical protein
LILALADQSVPTAVPGDVPWTATAVPLTCDADGTLIVPVSLQGASAHPFILDTGASMTLVDERLVRTLRLPAVGTVRLESSVEPRVHGSLRFEGVELTSLPFVSADLKNLKWIVPGVSGILGNDVLRALGDVTIDYRRCRLVLGELASSAATSRSAPTERLPAVTRRNEVPLTWHEGRPLVVIENDARLLLDSGASTLIVFTGTEVASSVRLDPGLQALVRIERLSSSSVGRHGRLPKLSIGAVRLTDVPAVVGPTWYSMADTTAPHGLLPLHLFTT